MKILDKNSLKNMLLGGAKFLEINKALIDSLNVFPVPDGDTGTNMSLTMNTAIKEIEKLENFEIDDLVNAYSTGSLRGARGNSGVILSQIIKGMCNVLFENRNSITTKVFAKSLVEAMNVAYAAVTKPKEGTILTVIRYMAENANKLAVLNSGFEQFLKALIAKGEEILAKTPDMLKVLKDAGVVDAGGKGLLCIFIGYYNAIAGIEMKVPEDTALVDSQLIPSLTYDNNYAIMNSNEPIKYAYCTEYFIVNIKSKTTEEDINILRDKLLNIGDCVICIGDLSLVKVHVHTNAPNRALYYALQLGDVDQIKIENMKVQNEKIKKSQIQEKTPIAILSICVGEGFKKIFNDLMVNDIIEGGQTMNPSVEDILSKIESMSSNQIIILPNNANILLAANQAKELTKKECFIVPTKNVPEGITAAMQFDYEISFEDNCENMSNSFENLKFGQVTSAVRTTEMDGIEVNDGDIIGLNKKTILVKGKNVNKVALDLAKKIVNKDEDDTISIYYGADITDSKCDQLVKMLEKEFPDQEVVKYHGGQPFYHYYLSIE